MQKAMLTSHLDGSLEGAVMKRRQRWLEAAVGIVIMLTAGCAGSKPVVTAPAAQPVVDVRAESFDFTPEVIRARRGEPLTLRVENVSGMKHNFTVVDPAGKVLLSRELPPKEKVTVVVPLATSGTYPFHCDLPMHPTLGMKGRLEVD
jgi:plastocyanin